MIIGVLGFIGSGKGTVGDILEQDHGFLKESFAKPVKDAVAPIFGWSRELLEGDTVQSRMFREQPDAYWSKKFGYDVTPRHILQLMGTEAGRNVFHENLWVDSLEKRMSRDHNYVITDVRFPNEMDMIHSLGGKIVRVVRGEEPEWYSNAVTTNQIHAGKVQSLSKYPEVHYSEWAWVGHVVDYVIENNGSLEELKSQVETYLTITAK